MKLCDFVSKSCNTCPFRAFTNGCNVSSKEKLIEYLEECIVNFEDMINMIKED